MKNETNKIKKIKVYGIQSLRGNGTVANQFIIETPDGVYFQSYRTLIAFKAKNGAVYLDAEAWNYSRTTSKYRISFLNEKTEDTKRKIKEGVYLLVNLNS